MSSILVTGAAGFIASRVSELLLECGHSVVGVDNLNDAYDVRLKKWRLNRLKQEDGFRFHALDICNRDALRKHVFDMYPFDAVINLAARAGIRQSVADPYVYTDTNLGGTLNLLEFCKKAGIKKFVLASTSSLYGKDNEMPFREDLDTNRPLSPYAASKKAAEAMSYTYHYLNEIDITVFRYFTVYGPAGRPDMSLFRFTQWINEGCPVTVFGDGRQSRDFTHVDDIARGTIAGLRPVGYEVINLGSDTPVVLMDAINIIEDAVGKKAHLEFEPRHSADITATWADVSKAKRLLDWQPEMSFENGIRSIAEWYQANSDWAKDIITDGKAPEVGGDGVDREPSPVGQQAST